MIISQSNKSGLHNPWVLGMFVLVLVVLSVNATFIYFATGETRSTLVERDYRTHDRKSNEELVHELRVQHALAWRTEIKKPQAVVTGKPVEYEISVSDKFGKPVSGTMQVVSYRASDASKDFSSNFAEVSPGQYRGYINFPLKGYWELHIRIQRGEERFGVDTDKFMVSAS
jgi:nitrogen fixation protein FixH